MALERRGPNVKTIGLLEPSEGSLFLRVGVSPAVSGVPHVQLPEQKDGRQSRAAARHVVDRLVLLDLHVLNTNAQTPTIITAFKNHPV